MQCCAGDSRTSYVDGWSLVHLLSGFATVFLAMMFMGVAESLVVCFALAVLWEMFEATSIGIRCQKYLDETYEGDSWGNCLADVCCNMLGGVLYVVV